MDKNSIFGQKSIKYRVDDIQPYKETFFLKFSSIVEKQDGTKEEFDCGWRFCFNNYEGTRDTKEGCEVAYDCYQGHKNKYYGREWIEDFIKNF